MTTIIAFFSLADANVRAVVLGSLLLGATAGAIGCFAVLRKRALIGDTLAHAALPGVVIGFLIAGGKIPLALLLGAIATAWLAALAVNAITARSKLAADTAMAVVLSVFFAAGVVLLTLVQQSGDAAQSGLSHFLFGRAASLMTTDVRNFAVLAIVSLVMLIALFKEFKLIAFDDVQAQALGLPARSLDLILTTLLVVAVVVGLQAVGVVLMAAMLITPAAAARMWTDRLPVMVWLSAIFGGVSGVIGAYVSTLAPQMPTGPWMVIAVTFLFTVSLLFAPERGVTARLRHFLSLRARTLEEHILKAFFYVGEQRRDWRSPVTLAQLGQVRFFRGNTLASGLKKLRRRGLVCFADGGLQLTDSGQTRAGRIVRVHRLWEMYLSQYMDLPADHVHRDADQIEHVLTPELEAKLEALLDRPLVDPHGETIPYDSSESRP